MTTIFCYRCGTSALVEETTGGAALPLGWQRCRWSASGRFFYACPKSGCRQVPRSPWLVEDSPKEIET